MPWLCGEAPTLPRRSLKSSRVQGKETKQIHELLIGLLSLLRYAGIVAFQCCCSFAPGCAVAQLPPQHGWPSM